MMSWSSKVLDLVDIKDVEHCFFVRMKGDVSQDKEKAEAVFGPVHSISVPEIKGEFGFVTEKMSEKVFDEKAQKLPEIITRIRIKA